MRVIPLVLAVVGLAPSPAFRQSDAIPLAVVRVEVISQNTSAGARPAIAVTLRNTGTQPIDAFGAQVSVTYPDGTIRQTGATTDCRIEAWPTCPGGRVKPGATDVMYLGYDLPQLSAAGLSFVARPSFAVFFDDTAVGLETSIEWSFWQRAGAARLWDIVARVLATRSSEGTPESTLQLLQREIQAERQSLNGVTAGTEIQMEITSALDHRAGRDPASYLAALIADAPARRRDARAHSARKRLGPPFMA